MTVDDNPLRLKSPKVNDASSESGPPLSAPGPISSQVFQPPPPNTSSYLTRKKKKVQQTATFFSPPSQSDAYAFSIQNDHLSKSDKQRKTVTPDESYEISTSLQNSGENSLNQFSKSPQILQYTPPTIINTGNMQVPLYESGTNQHNDQNYNENKPLYNAQYKYDAEGQSLYGVQDQYDPEGQPSYENSAGQGQFNSEIQPPYVVQDQGQPSYGDLKAHNAENQPPYVAQDQYDPEGQPLYGDFNEHNQYGAENQPPYVAQDQYEPERQPPYGDFNEQDQYGVEIQPPYVAQDQYDPEGQPLYGDFNEQDQYGVEIQPPYVAQDPYDPEGQPPYGDFNEHDQYGVENQPPHDQYDDALGQPSYGYAASQDQYDPAEQGQFVDFGANDDEPSYGNFNDPYSSEFRQAGLNVNNDFGLNVDKQREAVYIHDNPPIASKSGFENEQPVHRNIESPEGIGGCKIIESDIVSSLYMSYDWVIPSFSSLRNSEEKIVSPPFGSKDRFYHLVLYPCGANEGLGSHVSIFLKPIKSLKEEKEGRDWWRPISQFSIHAFGSLDSPLVTESSDPNEFGGFNASTAAWGFSKFLPLDMVESSLNSSDQLSLQAELYWPETDVLGSLFYDVELNPSEPKVSIFGPFGSELASWNVKVYSNLEKGKKFLSIFLQLSPPNQGIRKVASLKAKLCFGDTIISKTLTGGYTFSSVEDSYGWDNFISISEIGNFATCSLGIQIDYVQSSLLNVSYEANEAESLKREISVIQDSKAAVLLSLKKKDNEIMELQKSKAASKAKFEELVKSLRDELNDVHDSAKNLLESNKKVLYLKSNLISLMDKMNSETLSASNLPPDILNLQQQLQVYLLKNSQLESDLLTIKGELEAKKIECTELKISCAIQEVDSLDLNDDIPTSLPEAMDKVRDELAETYIAIEEATFKLPDVHNQETFSECANISADLIVRLAELEVSRANLLSNLPFTNVQEFPELTTLRNDLSVARKTLFALIRDMDFDSSFLQPEVERNDQSVSPSNTQRMDIQAMSPLKLDNTREAMSTPSNQNMFNHINPDIHASQVIVENVNEMKSVLDQLKQIISAEPSRRESMISASLQSQRREQNVITAIPANLEKWDPPLKQIVVPWSHRRKGTSASSFGFPLLVMVFASTLIFTLYASVFVLCSPDLSRRGSNIPTFLKSPNVRYVCSNIILPSWEKISDFGHSNVEFLVLDLFPNIYQKASHGTEFLLKLNKKSLLMLNEQVFRKVPLKDGPPTTDIYDAEQYSTPESPHSINQRSKFQKNIESSKESIAAVPDSSSNIIEIAQNTQQNIERTDEDSVTVFGNTRSYDLKSTIDRLDNVTSNESVLKSENSSVINSTSGDAMEGSAGTYTERHIDQIWQESGDNDAVVTTGIDATKVEDSFKRIEDNLQDSDEDNMDEEDTTENMDESINSDVEDSSNFLYTSTDINGFEENMPAEEVQISELGIRPTGDAQVKPMEDFKVKPTKATLIKPAQEVQISHEEVGIRLAEEVQVKLSGVVGNRIAKEVQVKLADEVQISDKKVPIETQKKTVIETGVPKAFFFDSSETEIDSLDEQNSQDDLSISPWDLDSSPKPSTKVNSALYSFASGSPHDDDNDDSTQEEITSNDYPDEEDYSFIGASVTDINSMESKEESQNVVVEEEEIS